MTRRTILPLIEHVSRRVAPGLARLPLSPNQITLAGLALGLAAALCYATGGYEWSLAGAGLLSLGYVLDACDGEVARIKGSATPFGDRLDTFADWIVHSAFFLALGVGAERAMGDSIWFWLGALAAAGGTINYALNLVPGGFSPLTLPSGAPSRGRPSPSSPWFDRALYAFRHLARDDFCFLVALLTLPGLAWLLLPAGAAGAQAYWVVGIVERARRRGRERLRVRPKKS